MTETATTVKETLEVITPYLEQAAEKLGTTAEYLWKLQVQQAYVDGVYLGIIFLFTAFMCYKWVSTCKTFWNLAGQYYDDGVQVACVLPMMLYTIVAACSLVYSLCHLQQFLTIWINTDYYALTKAIAMFKGVMH